MRIRIYWKLTIIFSLLIISALTGVYFYINSQLKSYVESRIEGNLKKDLLLNKSFLDNEASEKVAPIAAETLARRIGRHLDSRFTIIASDGTVIGDSAVDEARLDELENHLSRPEVQDALKNGFGKSRRFSTSVKKEMLYMAVPLGTGGERSILRLSLPLSEIGLVESKIRGIIGVALIVALSATLLASFLVSVMIARPLGEMASIANRLSRGDFAKKAAVYSNDETGDLARALNHMADEIESKVKNVLSEKAKLETVLASMFEGVMLIDENNRIVLMNPSLRKLFLIETPPEGKGVLEAVRNNEIQEITGQVLRGDESVITRELSIVLPEKRTIMVNAASVKRSGSTEGAVLVFHDITELKRLEEIRKDFVANVSHELRTPISTIKGYAETLLEGKVKDKETAREFLNIICQDANRLSDLINDLLDLSRIESGKMKMGLASIKLDGALKRCAGVLEKPAKDKNVTITLNIPDNLPNVLADEKRLAQVFLNLMDNAVKYTPDGGSVSVIAAAKGGFVQVNISDTGIGIPENDLPRIFERFYRVDKARSRELGGTGLGLSIVKHIVQAHNGQVWVQSAPDCGSTFSFTIPIA